VPHDPAMFDRCKLNWDERDTQKAHVKLHRDLLALRRRDAAFRAQGRGRRRWAVLAPELFVLRFLAAGAADERLLIVNFGVDSDAGAFAEPLVAPPDDHTWIVHWSRRTPGLRRVGHPAGRRR